MDTRNLEKKLSKLEKVRRELARKIDESYLRDNVTEFLMLEERYERVMHSISTLRSFLHRNSRSVATV